VSECMNISLLTALPDSAGQARRLITQAANKYWRAHVLPGTNMPSSIKTGVQNRRLLVLSDDDYRSPVGFAFRAVFYQSPFTGRTYGLMIDRATRRDVDNVWGVCALVNQDFSGECPYAEYEPGGEEAYKDWVRLCLTV
jgi:hypothetical protein